jgi:PAT family acetyl-CoA transporter-like MFS transporter 1
MVDNVHTSISSICLIISLYLLQGLNLGLSSSMPFFLIDRGATWKDRGTFNFAIYPFSFKLLWAPLIDVLYSDRFGRRKSWLIPVQVTAAGILLSSSFYIESLIAANRIILLTIIFFTVILLTATQDICVDGLAISLFIATNLQWASTSQTIGQALGSFLGSSFLMTFESANFTNKFIREPLSIPSQASGLFSIEQFTRFVAVAFLAVTICLIVFLREKKEVSTINGEETSDLSLLQTYLSIIKLLKKKCIRQLTLVSLIAPIGFVAINSMTGLALLR